MTGGLRQYAVAMNDPAQPVPAESNQRAGRTKPTDEVHPTSGYTVLEEVMNSLTHGIGLVWAIVALVLSVVYASLHTGPRLIVASAVYGVSLIVLYLSSFLYHTVRRLSWKRFLLVCDHACIYVLIAGTYTPFTLGPLRGPLGWTLFGIIWALAVLGVIKELVSCKRGGLLSSLIYLGMGWLCMVAVVPLFSRLSTMGFALLFAGGAAYSIGVIFYLWRRIKFHHAIWHLFVLGGSACHWLSIMTFLTIKGAH